MAKSEARASKADILVINKENVISLPTSMLIERLSALLGAKSDSADFTRLCRRVDSSLWAFHYRQFEELMDLYALFDPTHSSRRLQASKLTNKEVNEEEAKFLNLFFDFMNRSNFKILTDDELAVAKKSSYLLQLPIDVDKQKLDERLLTRYFSKHPIEGIPEFANQFVIFRRGVGVDKIKDFFFMEKFNVFVALAWSWLLSICLLGQWKERRTTETIACRVEGRSPSDCSQEMRLERVRLETMALTVQNIFGPVEIQEPTFERIIVIYRPATPKSCMLSHGDRSIIIKHFHHIPMADLEIVLPEKKNPSLAPMDWVKFVSTAVVGLVALVSTVEFKKGFSAVLSSGIAVAFFSYLSRLYFGWQASMMAYQNLVTKVAYDKQKDSGKGTLLHLCDDVVQQEVKEAILVYYALLSAGSSSLKELHQRCVNILRDNFGEEVEFDAGDGLEKLKWLKLVKLEDENFDKYAAVPLSTALDVAASAGERTFASHLL
eukprot:TRINITY_DN1308_c0_g1_i1.p1 TRINITY_DN1308_c0_g1~~TRINITY_DN1308_c0_g1_i1.p1  ORF type:complete len:505 (-),score=135.29 TRINITY_DN1308_c0_g1_i1:241-1713(-)